MSLHAGAPLVPRLARARSQPLGTVESTLQTAHGRHVVSGGTSGIGLLTARWLAQCGACGLAPGSRGGTVAGVAGGGGTVASGTRISRRSKQNRSATAHIRTYMAYIYAP